MRIRIDSLVVGARRATGAVVIVYVLPACTTAAVAFYRRNLLRSRRPDPEAARKTLLPSSPIAQFRDLSRTHLRPQDGATASQVDKHSFAMCAACEGDHLVARRCT